MIMNASVNRGIFNVYQIIIFVTKPPTMDAYSQINTNISRYVTFTEEELQLFNSLLEYKSVPKKTIILSEGEQCNFEAYVINGCVRKYYIDANGTEVTLQFAVEDGWVGDISFSIYDKEPSNIYIETLEDCEFFTLTLNTKEELYEKVPRFERAYRILLQRHLAVMQNRLLNTISKSATEKYIDFLQQYPTLPQRVAQHYIASYLGISAEFLSKVRTKLAKTE